MEGSADFFYKSSLGVCDGGWVANYICRVIWACHCGWVEGFDAARRLWGCGDMGGDER